MYLLQVLDILFRLYFVIFVCTGILVVSKVEPVGLGGSMNVVFCCNSCELRTVNFQGSALVEGSKGTVVGLALAVIFYYWAWLCQVCKNIETVPWYFTHF